MKKIGIVIISLLIATLATSLSPVVVRTSQTDVCHTYQKGGFPLSFVEELKDQPSKPQCLAYALSKAHPIYNLQNMAVDWLAFFILSVAGLAVNSRKKRQAPHLPPSKY